MKRTLITRTLMAVLAIVLMSFALREQKKVTVWMIGDSTMAIKDPKAFPETGWGMPFAAMFKKNVVVDNRAMNGRSTKSFVGEKRWDAVIANMKAGDFLIIEFGHNDEKIEKPKVGTTIPEFKANLARFVSEARAKKATPILMTPIARRHFENGTLLDTHKGYDVAVREVADSLKVPMVDMHKRTSALLAQLGDDKSIALFNHVPPGTTNYPEGKKDDTHLNVEGAKQLAEIAAMAIKEQKITLSKYLK